MEHTEHNLAREPEALTRLWVERARARDVAGLVALYEEGAVLATGDDEFAHGADEIRAFYTDFVASGPTFDDGEQNPVLRHGDLALTSTRLSGGGGTAKSHADRRTDHGCGYSIDPTSLSYVRPGRADIHHAGTATGEVPHAVGGQNRTLDVRSALTTGQRP